MGRNKLRILCAEGDREALQPVLDALQARGVSVSEKADTLLAVLSERFYADETLKTALLEAVSAGGAGVLPLRLDRAEQPPESDRPLVRNIIPADKRSPEQTAEPSSPRPAGEEKPLGRGADRGSGRPGRAGGRADLARRAEGGKTRREPRPSLRRDHDPGGAACAPEDLKSIPQRRHHRRRDRFLNSGGSQPNRGRLIVRLMPSTTGMGTAGSARPTDTNTA